MIAVNQGDQEKRVLKKAYSQLYVGVLAILSRHDPIGIAHDNPYGHEEYAIEARSILPRLKQARSASDVRRIIHEEFIRQFDSVTAGPEKAYEAIALEVWDAWNKSCLADKA